MRLDALLRPRSIAILGASERPSIGRALMESAATLRYEGRLYPINPKYTEILGQPCYPSMRELPEPPDVVALCVSYTRIVDSFRTVADRGAGGAVIRTSKIISSSGALSISSRLARYDSRA